MSTEMVEFMRKRSSLRRACEHAFVSIKGSPYARFRRALELGKLPLVLAAAAELPRLDLEDGLRVLVLMAEQDRGRFDRAAVRWLGRLALDRRLDVEDLRAGLAACELLRRHPAQGEAVLAELLRRPAATARGRR
jgi:hypothetical protein